MTTSMRIGDLDFLLLSDGVLKTSVDFVVGMERERARRLLGADEAGSVFIPVNNFLFRRQERIILIDAGAGDTMQPTLGRLPQELRSAGVDPSTITHIVLTHLHPDHANGLVDNDGKAIYENAELLVLAKELDFWMAENSGSEPQSVIRIRARNKINLKPYLHRIRTMREGEEAFGCSPILAVGHSPGHTCWRIEAGSAAVLAWGDCVHFSRIQIAHPDVAVTYDLDAEQARASRRRILELAASERLAIAGAHVAAPGVGHVSRQGDGFSFEPAAA